MLFVSEMAFAAKINRECGGFGFLLGIIVFSVGLAGCASDVPRSSTERPTPPMPTMGPSRTTATPHMTEEAIVTAAFQAAQQGDISGTLRILDVATESAERA